MLLNLVAKIWNGLAAPIRLGVAWLANAKFIHGVSGVILDNQGRILLLKHRFWKHQRWGLPGGHAQRGESLAATLRREMLEETGLDVRPTKLLQAGITRDRLTQFVLLAEYTGEPQVKSAEILEARFWDPSSLPENLLPAHRKIIEAFLAAPNPPALPLE
ncbi:MAG: NUDIX domain-containing protein [Chthoniobacteraceae bacterium]|jgi:ADP-ribose pyrophosphatase YjhB (NUDIX family)